MEIRSVGRRRGRKGTVGHHHVQFLVIVMRKSMRNIGTGLLAIFIGVGFVNPAAAVKQTSSAKPAAKASSAKAAAPAKTAPATQGSGVQHNPAPSPAKPATVQPGKGQGEMDVNITGKNKEKLVIGKFDPPA